MEYFLAEIAYEGKLVADFPEEFDLAKSFFEEMIIVPQMAKITGGNFEMGEVGITHKVSLDSFEIGVYPITQRQWKAIMGNNPSHFKGDNLPVEEVSWKDCQAFIKRLNKKTGLKYRLPTEAEWEYAAGGGAENRTKYAGTNEEASLEDYAWYGKNSNSKTHPVGDKKPNALGLYDMSGNVWEWCEDRYGEYPVGPLVNPTGPNNGAVRVIRGGSWFDVPGDCRVALRGRNSPDSRSSNLGFRLARTP